MVRTIISFCLGFTSGVIYTSNKYDHNPNEIFNEWKNSATDAGKKAVDTVKDSASNLKAKKSGKVEATVEA